MGIDGVGIDTTSLWLRMIMDGSSWRKNGVCHGVYCQFLGFTLSLSLGGLEHNFTRRSGRWDFGRVFVFGMHSAFALSCLILLSIG